MLIYIIVPACVRSPANEGGNVAFVRNIAPLRGD